MIGPLQTRRINGGEVPEDTFTGTTILLGLWFAGVGGKALCEQVPAVPVLVSAQVRDQAEDGRAGTHPVGDQDRLPDGEHAYVQVAVLLQNLLGCGGPPQTGRSGGREQDDYAGTIGGLVEFGAELFEREIGGGGGRASGEAARDEGGDKLGRHGHHRHQHRA